MVLGAPRSGTTWASNWLTTEKTLCLHDPLLIHAETELDDIPCDRLLGISCTALPLHADFVNAHPAPKVIVHRSREAIDQSLVAIGLTRLRAHWDGALNRLEGMHVDYRSLFQPKPARDIFEYLTHLPFDEARHRQLSEMYIEPKFDRVQVVPDRAVAFRRKVEAALMASA